MENIFPLILIIIVFNVISAILKAFRGGKGAAQKVVQPPFAQPAEQVKIKLWADDSYEENSPEPEYDYDYETEEEIAESVAAPVYPPPLPEEVYVMPPVQKVHSARGTRATTDGNTRYGETGQPVSPATVFASNNAFLNAYLFHELLQPPVSMRKKR
jgi:hypothetical protein